MAGRTQTTKVKPETSAEEKAARDSLRPDCLEEPRPGQAMPRALHQSPPTVTIVSRVHTMTGLDAPCHTTHTSIASVLLLWGFGTKASSSELSLSVSSTSEAIDLIRRRMYHLRLRSWDRQDALMYIVLLSQANQSLNVPGASAFSVFPGMVKLIGLLGTSLASLPGINIDAKGKETCPTKTLAVDPLDAA